MKKISLTHRLAAVLTALAVMAAIVTMVMPRAKTEAYSFLSRGIDVSKHQGTINWTSVANSGVDFAIIRAGSTNINAEAYGQDSKFETNYSGAKKAGIKVGAYYYCGAYTEAGFKQNAYDFLNSLSGKSFEYPVYIDIEQASKQQQLGKSKLTTYILTALDIIRSNGYTAGVYANKDWMTNYIDASRIRAAGYEIWWAQYPSGSYAVDPTGYDKSNVCGVWQYSSLGKVSGISGNVDLNVSYVDYSCTSSDDWSTADAGKYTTKNVSTNLNMRSGAGTSYSVIAKIPAGATVNVIKTRGSWAYVEYNGNKGYCSLSYLEKVKTAAFEFTASASSVSLNYSKGETKTVKFSYKNAPADSVTIQFVHGSKRITNCEWGEWSNHSINLSIEGYSAGTETITVNLLDTDSGAVLGSKTVKVTVTSSPMEFTASSSSVTVNKDKGETKTVTFSYKNAPADSVTIQFVHGSKKITTCEWGEWSNHSIKLSIEGFSEGTETITVNLLDTDSGAVLGSKTVKVTVTSSPMEFNVSASAVTVNMDKSETKTVTFSCANIPSRVSSYNIRFIHGDKSLTTLKWEDWIGSKCNLNITGKYIGTETITFEVFDSDTKEILATKTVTVTVTGTPKVTASASTIALDFNKGESKQITFSCFNTPHTYSLRFDQSSSGVTSCSWGKWTDNTTTLTIGAAAPGTDTITIELLSDGKVIATTAVKVTVSAKFNVSFNAQGGKVSVSSKTVAYNGTYGTLPVPVRDEYVFQGWYTASTGGKLVTDASKVSITSDITLYAQWKKAANPQLDLKINGFKKYSAMPGERVSVTYEVSGADLSYCSTSMYIMYDSRLNLIDYESGSAIAKLASMRAVYKTGEKLGGSSVKVPKGFNVLSVSTFGAGDFGRDGTIYTFTFEVPETAIADTVYSFGFITTDESLFTNNAADTAGSEMQKNAFANCGSCELSVSINDGDINIDGKVNADDAMLLQKYLLHTETFTENQFICADINKDGYVDVFDMGFMRDVLVENGAV